MAFAPPKNLEGPKMQTKLSTWTPLNHQLMNDKVFEERRNLLGKWFDKWTDSQRRRVFMDLFQRCSLAQLKFCLKQLQDRVPPEALDFTAKLPRALSLYIFSFLDPWSLSRCAQIPPKEEFEVFDVQPIARGDSEVRPAMVAILNSAPQFGKKTGKEKKALPPWRSSDKHPTDTVRFNYLDNLDPIEQARQAISTITDCCYKFLEVSLSADLALQPKAAGRPGWATYEPTGYPVTRGTAKILAQSARWNAGIRPAPAWGPVPKLSEMGQKAFARTSRSSPTSPLFESKPWHIPESSPGSEVALTWPSGLIVAAVASGWDPQVQYNRRHRKPAFTNDN
ncbi:hypothetical protein JRQ81_005365 [Phrynocephalus forsythii]|uniref:F-box protein 16 n=1 Tax=Phrynocephalus forsythii TaxID=171643 RepID=A0A9Q0Y5F3_9SAUR|nr:hypothetical protein JRQ81_005365 [Phrynocephalus forsythii]